MNELEKRLTITLLDREDVMIAQSKRIRSDSYHIQGLEYEIKILKRTNSKQLKTIKILQNINEQTKNKKLN